MAKDAHTGGAGARWETDGRFITPEGKPGDVLAETTYRRRGSASKDVERFANARLMAAAPEMLDALREILNDATNDLTEDARNTGLNAVASATGGEG